MIRVIVPIAQQVGLNALRIGALVTIAAQFGRTSSPVAPIVMLCAALSSTHPLDLLRRVFPPLLAGGAVLIIAALLGLI
jgi:C4-dicarboxylate transporter